MHPISEKTLRDLEFFTILDMVGNYCISDLGRAAAKKIRPIVKKTALLAELDSVNEYHSSFENDNRIPSHYFEDITKELHLLQIENSFLEAASFLKITTNTNALYELLKFLKTFKEIYPVLYQFSCSIDYEPEISKKINDIITPFGEIIDNATPLLKQIRKDINSVRSKIGSSFTRALNTYNTAGFLDEIRESVVDNQRVLAVQAMFRKKVKGSMVGSSKTGSIVYIAPEATLQFSRELQNLTYEEHQEIVRILKGLTNEIRQFLAELHAYQEFFIKLDLIGAKAKFSHTINGCLPKYSAKKHLFLKEAYHPILWIKNKEQNIETIPQTIELNEQQQIIVISGPNAGGKSITLKTIGLLQLMLQSGMLIPVHERSSTCFFDKILTDIGDNQSIENQLSTYSYRLKNMRNFLRKCNANTLFLIDEFGTGSDPELGGAMAEIFLEEFYEKKAFGIITTHYANLKVLANELENVANANMEFDEKSLEPLFKLYIGQAGSSFTFEVAQKNGIPFRLINKAKKRVEGEKIRLDRTIAKLQKERSKLQKSTAILDRETSRTLEKSDNLTEKEQKIQEKLEGFQNLYDNNQKMLQYGRKINEFLHRYFQTNNKKQLNQDFNKWLSSEKAKHLKKNPIKPKTKAGKKEQRKTEVKKKEVLASIEKEVVVEVKKVRQRRENEKKLQARKKADYTFKVHDKVRIIDSNACGTIEKIERQTAFINIGVFTTQTSLDKLELVEASK